MTCKTILFQSIVLPLLVIDSGLITYAHYHLIAIAMRTRVIKTYPKFQIKK